MTTSSQREFTKLFQEWLSRWEDFLKEKTVNEVTNRWQYTHRSLRSAVQSFREKFPFLFTHQEFQELNIPNTNKVIEGVFTALKSALRNHNGMSQENKKRLVSRVLRHRGKSSE